MGDTSGTMFMGLSIQYAALLGLVSVVAVLGSVWLCRRGRSTRAEPDKPGTKLLMGARRAGTVSDNSASLSCERERERGSGMLCIRLVNRLHGRCWEGLCCASD